MRASRYSNRVSDLLAPMLKERGCDRVGLRSTGHVKLPDNDNEIIVRALAIKPLADRKVTLLTYDTGQSMRARKAGLKAVELSKDIGEEPK